MAVNSNLLTLDLPTYRISDDLQAANVKFTGSVSDPVERRVIPYVLSLSDSMKRHYRLDDGYEEDGDEDALRSQVVEMGSSLSQEIGMSGQSKKATQTEEQRKDRSPTRVLRNQDQSPKNDK